jgi:predicted amidophosphoribosyltransferase
MAIITCPNCSKSISNKNKKCPHCEMNLNDTSDEQLKKMANQKKVKQQQTYMNYSFLSLILFLSGFLYLYKQQPAQDTLEMLMTQLAIAAGCIWYIINRVILVYLKKKK